MIYIETKNFTEKFQSPEFKPMINNLQEKSHQGYLKIKGCKNAKNAPKPSLKYFQDKICKYAKSKKLKYSINPKDIFKSAKKKNWKNLTLKRTP